MHKLGVLFWLSGANIIGGILFNSWLNVAIGTAGILAFSFMPHNEDL